MKRPKMDRRDYMPSRTFRGAVEAILAHRARRRESRMRKLPRLWSYRDPLIPGDVRR